ncbi:hypothetical protein TeGR_g11430, partial [Tetraparma gracilis]
IGFSNGRYSASGYSEFGPESSEEEADDAAAQSDSPPAPARGSVGSAAGCGAPPLGAASAGAAAPCQKWTKDSDKRLRNLVALHGQSAWPLVARLLNGDSGSRTHVHCMNRWYKVLKPGMRKGPWTKEEDALLREVVGRHPNCDKVKWSAVAAMLPGRIGKQCRERYFNHLDPTVKKGKWSVREDTVIFAAQIKMGNQWCEIAK